MRKLSQNLYVYSIIALVLSSCGGLGTQAVLNPASGFQSPGFASENAATTSQDNNDEQESEESILMPDGSVVTFDQNGNIVASDTPTATLNPNPDRPSTTWETWDSPAQSGDDSFDETYAYAPQDQQDYSETNAAAIPDVFDDFNNTANDSSNPENANPNNPNNSNSIDVNNQENLENSVETNNDPLDELAHLPVTVAKNNNIPPFDPSNPDSTDSGDEEEDCGEGETTQIDIGGDDNEGNNEFEDPNSFGGPGSDPDSNSNSQNTISVGVTDCGDEEEENDFLDEESDSNSNYFADRDMELVIVQTEQNPTTGKWELADNYVIVAAENPQQNTGKINFKVDTSLLNNSNSGATKSPRIKTHLILKRANP